MNKTFLSQKEEMLIALQKHMSFDLSDNPDVNQSLRYLLLVITKQYLIETYNPDGDYVNLVQRETIEKWGEKQAKIFYNLYGMSLWGENDYQQYENDIYYIYIDDLCKNNLLERKSYDYKEKDYMMHHHFFEIKLNKDKNEYYSYKEIVFLDTYI